MMASTPFLILAVALLAMAALPSLAFGWDEMPLEQAQAPQLVYVSTSLLALEQAQAYSCSDWGRERSSSFEWRPRTCTHPPAVPRGWG